MPNNTIPRLDVDELMRRIRAEVASSGAATGAPGGARVPAAPAASPSSEGNGRGAPSARQVRILQQLLGVSTKTIAFVRTLGRRVAGHSVALAVAEREIDALKESHAEITRQLRIAEQRIDELRIVPERRLNELADKVSERAREILYLKEDLTLLKLVAGRRQNIADLPSGAGAAGAREAADNPADDLEPFYTAHQERFRGDRDDVTERCAVYLPRIEALAAAQVRPLSMLDLGCGRGEWLALMHTRGAASGVDSNARTVAECRARGLDVVHADALSHLRALPERSLDVVTAFHVIEHLPFRTLLDMAREIYRVLRPGGIVILETPNPENLLVASHSFHLDPTHQWILPPAYTSFVLEQVGFSAVVTVALNPNRYAPRLDAEPTGVSDLLNQLLYGPQDYAAVATKPTVGA